MSHCYAHATPVCETKPLSHSMFYEGFDRCYIVGVGVMSAQGCMLFADICFVNYFLGLSVSRMPRKADSMYETHLSFVTA